MKTGGKGVEHAANATNDAATNGNARRKRWLNMKNLDQQAGITQSSR
jgi:hypothetical protein